jgi:hypothetical protein
MFIWGDRCGRRHLKGTEEEKGVKGYLEIP